MEPETVAPLSGDVIVAALVELLLPTELPLPKAPPECHSTNPKTFLDPFD